jgi:glycosyltransferase involved in cell wall biosynthesis
MKPWLAVILPIHGGEHFLAATLESAAREVPRGVEFLLYNSADDDGVARRIADSFADRLDLRWNDTPDLPSWMAKTNRGVQDARAAHVAMLHQDDLWLPGHIAAVKHAIIGHPHAALSIAATRFADSGGRVFGRWRLPFHPGPVASDDFLSTLLVQNSIAIPSPIVHRESWLRAGGLDEALWYTADWDLYLKLANEGPVVVREPVTTAFRLHGGSLTMTGSRDAADFRAQLERVFERHSPRLPAAMRRSVERRARASIEVNCALARASREGKGALVGAVLQFLRLSPPDLVRYLRQSRIIDRVVPRLQLAVSGRI